LQTPQKLFYRVSKLGADVYRIDLQNRLRRLDLEKIAEIDVLSDNIIAEAGKSHSQEEVSDMQLWCQSRREQLELRSQNDINRLVEAMNHAANWIDNDATDSQTDKITDSLLMAMHDLRATLVRKMAAKKNRS